MAARSIGSITLTFGLLAIPLKVYTATSAKSVGFNLLHRGCGSRLKQQLLCPIDNVVVERSDTDRGFEYAKDQYVKFTDDEIKALEAERDDTLELLEFVPATTVDLLHIEKTQYLGPDKGGDRGYQLLSLAMEDKGRVGVGRWRTRGKDTLVIVCPYAAGGLVMHQVFYGSEVRDFAEIPRAEVDLHAAELSLACKLVEQLAGPALDPSRYHDTWAEKVMVAIRRKVDGEDFVRPTVGPKAEVFDLLEALQRSVASTAPPSGRGPKKAVPRKGVRKAEPRARRASAG